jgi:DNA-binding MurR/RpiR family transcriptional regulator
MWERGRPIDDMLEMSKFSYNRVKEIIQNHIGETHFDAVARSVKNKMPIADIAASVELPEATVVRIIDFFDFK